MISLDSDILFAAGGKGNENARSERDPSILRSGFVSRMSGNWTPTVHRYVLTGVEYPAVQGWTFRWSSFDLLSRRGLANSIIVLYCCMAGGESQSYSTLARSFFFSLDAACCFTIAATSLVSVLFCHHDCRPFPSWRQRSHARHWVRYRRNLQRDPSSLQRVRNERARYVIVVVIENHAVHIALYAHALLVFPQFNFVLQTCFARWHSRPWNNAAKSTSNTKKCSERN